MRNAFLAMEEGIAEGGEVANLIITGLFEAMQNTAFDMLEPPDAPEADPEPLEPHAARASDARPAMAIAMMRRDLTDSFSLIRFRESLEANARPVVNEL